MSPEEKMQLLIGKMMMANAQVEESRHAVIDAKINAIKDMLSVMEEIRDFQNGEGRGLVG